MPRGSRDRKSRDNSSSDSSDSSDDNLFTKRKGRSKVTIYQDTDVAERVTKVVGDCDKLSLVETPYTKWGIHLVERREGRASRGPTESPSLVRTC